LTCTRYFCRDLAALANVVRSIDIPFVSGGDAATFAIAGMMAGPVIAALPEAC
jgi:hypothetical protein